MVDCKVSLGILNIFLLGDGEKRYKSQGQNLSNILGLIGASLENTKKPENNPLKDNENKSTKKCVALKATTFFTAAVQ